MEDLIYQLARAYGIDVLVVAGVGGNAVTITNGLKKRWGWRGWIVPVLCGTICLLLSVAAWVTVNVAKVPGHADYKHVALVALFAILWGVVTGKWQSLMPDNRPDNRPLKPVNDELNGDQNDV